jgi:AcrR family transcriptional regulator
MARTATKTNLVPQAILDAASQLFLQQGFGGTTMQDIAAELGVTRTAVYYYYKNKEEILTSLTEGVTLFANQLASQLVGQMSDPVAALRGLTVQHAKLILSHPAQFRVVEHSENFLLPAQRKIAETARRTLFENFSTVIDRGVNSGHFRLVDPSIAAFSIIGMCNWSAWWFNRAGRKSIDDVAESIADLALHAVQREEAPRSRGRDVDESLRVLQEELDFLKLSLVRQ